MSETQEPLGEEQRNELQALIDSATPLPWDTGPTTAAGDVWVYRRGDPLAEPVNPRDWRGYVRNLFRLRSVDRWNVGDASDPAWRRVEANAALVVGAVNVLPVCLVRVAELEAEVERLEESRQYWQTASDKHREERDEAKVEVESLRRANRSFFRDKMDEEKRILDVRNERWEDANECVAKLKAERDEARAEAKELREKLDRAERETGRLTDWLLHIGGGDHPCDDAAQLRRWAYEATTLARPCEFF